MSEKKLVIFDCDGVLINSESIAQEVLLSLLHDKGATVDVAYFDAHFLGRSFVSVAKKVEQDFQIVLDSAFQTFFRQALFDAFDNDLTATDGIEHVLKTLNVSYCVATSGSPAKVSHTLGLTRLDAFFKGRIYTASQVKQGKPAPDLFLHVAKQMGYEPAQCIVIEDSLAGLQAALSANMTAIQFNGATHTQHRGQEALIEGVDVISSWVDFEQHFPALFLN